MNPMPKSRLKNQAKVVHIPLPVTGAAAVSPARFMDQQLNG